LPLRQGDYAPIEKLAKELAGGVGRHDIAEKDMLHHLGTLGIGVFRYGTDQERHITKADARKLIGIEGAE